jgi:hypothetical protein
MVLGQTGRDIGFFMGHNDLIIPFAVPVTQMGLDTAKNESRANVRGIDHICASIEKIPSVKNTSFNCNF